MTEWLGGDFSIVIFLLFRSEGCYFGYLNRSDVWRGVLSEGIFFGNCSVFGFF